MRGLWNHDFLQLGEEKFKGTGFTLEKGTMMYEGYVPFVNFDNDQDTIMIPIKGEIFEISQLKLELLD